MPILDMQEIWFDEAAAHPAELAQAVGRDLQPVKGLGSEPCPPLRYLVGFILIAAPIAAICTSGDRVSCWSDRALSAGALVLVHQQELHRSGGRAARSGRRGEEALISALSIGRVGDWCKSRRRPGPRPIGSDGGCSKEIRPVPCGMATSLRYGAPWWGCRRAVPRTDLS